MDTTKSKKVLKASSGSSGVPQRRFYTAIKQLFRQDREEAGGYTKAKPARQHQSLPSSRRDALIQYTKHAAPKINALENNLVARMPMFGYRMVPRHKNSKLSGMYSATTRRKRIYYGYYRISARRRADPRGQRAACAGQCSACRRRRWNCRSR